MVDVFISYSRLQRERVAFIAEKLEALKLSVWFDVQLGAGEGISDRIRREIDGAGAVLVCWDKIARKSEWVCGEAAIARQLGKLVPCQIEPTELDPPFNSVHAEDISAWEGDDSFAAWLKILERIGVLADRPGLARYAQILGEGAAAAPLRKWAIEHGDDSLAETAWDRLRFLETENDHARLTREQEEARSRDRSRKQVRRVIHRIRSASQPRNWASRAAIGGLSLVVAAITLLVLVSVSNGVDTALHKSAFEARRDAQQQFDRVRQQEILLRRAVDEFRGDGGTTGRLSRRQVEEAIDAATLYLERGRQSYANERLMEAVARADRSGASLSTRSLLRGVVDLAAWERNENVEGLMVSSGRPYSDARISTESGLPAQLSQALISFERAADDRSLAPIAYTGVAWVRFLRAARSEYAPGECARALQAIAQIAARGSIGPLPLYWRAQCQRKNGSVLNALADYSTLVLMLGDDARDEADVGLAVNAFHGLGTVLVGASDAPQSDPRVAAALDVASRYCRNRENRASTPRMRLAAACLNEAVRLRTVRWQTEFQIGASRENISFAYLRDRQFDAAYDNAVAVERIGLLVWNELVRALAAEHVRRNGSPQRRQEAARIAREARRNIRYFRVPQFDVCELRVLLHPELFGEAIAIISRAHPGERVACDRAARAG